MKTIECSELILKLRTKEKELENLRKLMSVLEKKVMKSRSSIADKSITIKKLTEDNKNLRERNSDLKKYNRDTDLLHEKNRQSELALKLGESKLKLADIYLQKELSEAASRARYVFFHSSVYFFRFFFYLIYYFVFNSILILEATKW